MLDYHCTFNHLVEVRNICDWGIFVEISEIYWALQMLHRGHSTSFFKAAENIFSLIWVINHHHHQTGQARKYMPWAVIPSLGTLVTSFKHSNQFMQFRMKISTESSFFGIQVVEFVWWMCVFVLVLPLLKIFLLVNGTSIASSQAGLTNSIFLKIIVCRSQTVFSNIP